MQPPFRSTVPLIPAPASAYRPHIVSAPPGIGSTAPTASTTSTSGGALTSTSSHMMMSSTAPSSSSLYPTGSGSTRNWSAAAGEPDPKVARSQLLTGALSVTLGLLSLALLIGWLKAYHGGFSLDGDSATRFNLHPLCMVLAIALLLTNGVLAWRLWPMSHGLRKTLHVVMNATALALVGLGLYFVYSTLGAPHNYSMHSWLGLATALLLALQALTGLLYLLPAGGRSKLGALPHHAWFGLAVYTLALLTVITGVMNLFALLSVMSASGGGGGGISSHLSPLLQSKNFSTLVPNSRESIVGSLLGLTLFTLLLSTLHAVMPRRRTDATGAYGSGSGSSSSGMGAGSETMTMTTTSPEARPIASRFPMYSR